MLDIFNSCWTIIVAILLLYFILKKIYNLNKPFDEDKFINQLNNQEKLKKNLNLDFFKQSIPDIAHYYIF